MCIPCQVFLKNSASSLFLSGWLHISSTGFRSVEMCTGPFLLRDGILMTGFRTVTISSFLLLTGGGGIVAPDGLLMIACCITFNF